MKARLTISFLTSITVLTAAVSARAATITVTSMADAGGTCPGTSCTLRQAIATALAGDTINFALPANSTINLTSSGLGIGKNLTIKGPGANLLSLQRGASAGSFGIIEIVSFVNATISGLTIANGNDGGVFNLGTLTLTSVTISGNSAVNFGGGIFNGNDSTLILSNSTISGNSAKEGGGIYNIGSLTLINSTVSGNSASVGRGGGISNFDSLTLTNSTISSNSAVGVIGGDGGGGIASLSDAGMVNVRNTIIARNTATLGSPDFFGLLTSQGYNLIGNTSGTMITGTTTGNQLNVDPVLGPLQDNGGPTFTHALLSGSPAIEGGDSSGANTDQRGLARPVDSPVINNATDGDGSDIGAYEVQADQLPGCSDINRIVTNNNDSGPDSLRAVIASVCAGTTITFAPNVTGAINLTSGELLLDKSVTINGPGANLLSVQRSAAAGNFRIFNITPSQVIATISGLTIANGNSPSDGGGISSTGALTMANCALSGNTTGSSGGGLVSSGPLTILNSTISANSATGGGGGGLVIAGTADMTNSTISGNSASELNFGIGFGGGIHISAGTLTVTNSTITSNSAQFRGGGIINSSGTLRSRNTIIALNTAGTGGGPDVFGPLLSEGFNLIGDNSDATITPAQFSDQIGMAGSPIDPLLGPLQNNGGPTFTQTLLVSSRAINKANAAIAPERDQRGYVRFDAPDVGAFEFGATIPVTLANISTRVTVETGDMVLIGGFIVTGTEPKKVIVRAIGPSLPVAGKLANPTLELYDASGLLVSNDNWKSTQQAEIEATTIPPPNDLEAAIVATLPANNSAYTAIVRGANDTSGVGLVEVYDLDRTVDSKLANISTRGLVQTGDDVIIGGLIVLGADPQNVIVRAIGPSLPVAGRLADPMLELHDADGALVVSNDNWRSDQEAEIIATTVAPTNDLESAIVRTLAPASYTAIVRGVGNTTGVALVEAYALN